jgi:hypothetical protein
VSVPFGTRTLYIGCGQDIQFKGIHRILRDLQQLPGSHLLDGTGTVTDLSRRRVLRRVLISGHGRIHRAGFRLAGGRRLEPSDLLLPRFSNLYLVGCYQGGENQIRDWSSGTGVITGRIRGCSGETESALSTCLLLHLLEDGVESIERWFPVWVRCNDSFRPHFPLIRRTYDRMGADPLAALAFLKNEGNLGTLVETFGEFLGVIQRHPSYLSDLT